MIGLRVLYSYVANVRLFYAIAKGKSGQIRLAFYRNLSEVARGMYLICEGYRAVGDVSCCRTLSSVSSEQGALGGCRSGAGT